MEKNHIRVIDFILIAGTIVALILIIGYTQPLVTAPLPQEENSSSILFSFPAISSVTIDTSSNFTTSKIIEHRDSLTLHLEPGTYYLKWENASRSEVRTLTLTNKVELQFKKTENRYDVLNAGKNRLRIQIYNNNTLVGNVILAPSEIKGGKQ